MNIPGSGADLCVSQCLDWFSRANPSSVGILAQFRVDAQLGHRP